VPVFFVSPDQIHDGHITITDPLLTHLRSSLRVQVEDSLLLADEQRRRYLIRVVQSDKRSLRGLILEEQAGPPITHPSIILGQALIKGDRMDWVVQKASELGIASFIPLVTTHTVVRPSPSRQDAQRDRWQRIALEAAQQSEQWSIPRLHVPSSAHEFFSEPVTNTLKLILSERTSGQSLAVVELPRDPGNSIRLAIGPEGGWTQEELAFAAGHGFVSITLGERILRTETAAIAALSILQSRLGALG
jgi:16S rRNA (uracil1498-N3)-methyltransferase